jgi:hypothetical protein
MPAARSVNKLNWIGGSCNLLKIGGRACRQNISRIFDSCENIVQNKAMRILDQVILQKGEEYGR